MANLYASRCSWQLNRRIGRNESALSQVGVARDDLIEWGSRSRAITLTGLLVAVVYCLPLANKASQQSTRNQTGAR